jgi:hypothetical protein
MHIRKLYVPVSPAKHPPENALGGTYSRMICMYIHVHVFLCVCECICIRACKPNTRQKLHLAAKIPTFLVTPRMPSDCLYSHRQHSVAWAVAQALCVCVYIYICIYVCIYVCTYECLYVCMCIQYLVSQPANIGKDWCKIANIDNHVTFFRAR